MWHPAILAMQLFSLVRAAYDDDTGDDGTGLAWTRSTPGFPRYGGEYNQPIFFHTMMKGYARRVYIPEDADLFYLPFYNQRLHCHADAGPCCVTKWEKFLIRVAAMIGEWIDRFPEKDGMGPRFFTAAGQVCSCMEPKRENKCNPASRNSSLDDRVVTLAWETPVPGLAKSLPNVVVPYITTLHDVLPWRLREKRELLAIITAGNRARWERCSSCGPCGPSLHSVEATCACNCNHRRHELLHAFNHVNNSDVQLYRGSLSAEGLQVQERYRMKLRSTFCVEPIGDTVTRKSFYESIMLGCIPVVGREDLLYLDQLPFSNTIPYRRLWVVFSHGTDIFAMLRAISHKDIVRRRRVIKRYARRLTFSSNNSHAGGYNDFGNPDAFASALKEVWDRTKQPKRKHLVKPAKCDSEPCGPAKCHHHKLPDDHRDKYSHVGGMANIGKIANISESDFPKVFILPVPNSYNTGLLSCDRPWLVPWHAKHDDVEYFGKTSPELPFGPVEKHFRPVPSPKK